MKSENPQLVLVPPHFGKVIEFLSVQNKLTGQQTGEAYYVFESVFDPGTGNRLHVHQYEDEFAYVLEGALEIRLQDEILVVETGGLAHLPKRVPHALRNPLDIPSRYLFMAVPAGMDRWFDALDAARQNGTLNESLYHKLALEYGIEFLE